MSSQIKMTLKDLLKDYPHISLATEAENEELLEYYHQTELAAKESTVIYKRGKNFFAFLQERSDQFLIFTLRDDQKKLHGVAVASYRPGYINGELQTIGYLGDLRVSLNRKLIREWRKFYALFLEKSPFIPDTGFCRYYQTALMSTNAYSKTNLADTKIPNLYYKELARYQMINIIGKFGSRSSPYQANPASPEEISEMIDLLDSDHRRRMFGHDWKREFEHRKNKWQNFTLEDWIVIRNNRGKMVAATSLWNPIASKQIIVPHIPRLFKIISKLTAFVPALTLKPLPEGGRPIDILYINQVSFLEGTNRSEQQQILRTVIELAFKRKFNMLAYCDFERENLTKDMTGLITQKSQMGFYTVHFKDENGSIRDELILNDSMLSPAFDMGLV